MAASPFLGFTPSPIKHQPLDDGSSVNMPLREDAGKEIIRLSAVAQPAGTSTSGGEADLRHCGEERVLLAD